MQAGNEKCVPFCLRDMLRDSTMKTRIEEAEKRKKYMTSYVYKGCKSTTGCHKNYKAEPDRNMQRGIPDADLKSHGFTNIQQSRDLLTKADKWRWVVWQIQTKNADSSSKFREGRQVYNELFQPGKEVRRVVENELGMRVNEYNPPHYSYYSVNQYLYYGPKHRGGGQVWAEARNHFGSAAVFAPDPRLERVSMQFFASDECIRFASLQKMNLAEHGYTGKNPDDTSWVYKAAYAWNGSGKNAENYAKTTAANYKKLRQQKALQDREVCGRNDQFSNCH